MAALYDALLAGSRLRGHKAGMIRIMVIVCAAALLASCAGKSTVNITHGSAQMQTRPRSEPVFYNGKTYMLDYSYVESASAFDMRVSGMGPKQHNDAVALATSSLRHFACTGGQSSQMTGEPNYVGGVWRLQARCV